MAAQFFAALKRADDNIITESSHNTRLNKQCMSSPPKVPVSVVFCFRACVSSEWLCCMCSHSWGGAPREGEGEPMRVRERRHSQTEILHTDK